MKDFRLPQEPTKLCCDRKRAIHLVKNSDLHNKFKHIDVKLHFNKDIVENGSIIIEKINTWKDQIDALTKIFNFLENIFLFYFESIGCKSLN